MKRLRQPLMTPRKDIYVSATDTRHALMNDHLTYFLKARKRDARGNTRVSASSFNDYLRDQGAKHEEVILSLLCTKYKVKSLQNNLSKDAIDEAKRVILTREYDVLHSVPLQEETDMFGRVQGIADFLFSPKVVEQETGHRVSNVDYVVVDAKFCSIPYRADGENILNSGSFPAYKGQVCVYNAIVNHITKRDCSTSYILGRNFEYGAVPFSTIDKEVPLKTLQAIDWCREVITNLDEWTLFPPSHPLLYPNMAIDSYEFNTQKESLARDIGDITMIWNCGYAQRNLAFSKGVYSWRDERLTADVLGFTGIRKGVVDAILHVNRSKDAVVTPNEITHNRLGWKDMHLKEAFVDFETFLSVNDGEGKIFMIGAYISGKYTCFKASANSREAERDLITSFDEWLVMNGVNKIWYWHAESSIWSKRTDGMTLSNTTEWCDMAHLFRSTPIAIKGCFDYSLKSVVNAMKKHGLIESSFDASEVSSGIMAGYEGWLAYKDESQSDGRLALIEEYNKIDVQSLHEILLYLRTNRA